MSRTLELPDSLYEALRKAAEDSGTTPAGWLTAHLFAESGSEELSEKGSPKPQTLADLFAGRVGRIRSGGRAALSERCGEQFTDYLEEKRRGGHL